MTDEKEDDLVEGLETFAGVLHDAEYFVEAQAMRDARDRIRELERALADAVKLYEFLGCDLGAARRGLEWIVDDARYKAPEQYADPAVTRRWVGRAADTLASISGVRSEPPPQLPA